MNIVTGFCPEIPNRKRKRKLIMEHQRSDLDQQSEEETRTTKISDSGYSTGCSKSQSQKSESSKSMQSNSTTEEFPQPQSSDSSMKNKDHKKKKNKGVREAIGKNDCKDVDQTFEKTSDETADSIERNPAKGASDSTNNLNNKVSLVNCAVKTIAGNQSNTPEMNVNLNLNGHEENANNSRAMRYFISATEDQKSNKKLKGTEENLNIQFESIELDEMKEIPESLLKNIKNKPLESTSDQFYLAVSMHDGKILHTTSTLTDVLGFPTHMWIGRSFIDFVHQKDKFAFADHITLAFEKTRKTWNNVFFCCLRKYRGLKTSVLAVDDKVCDYIPIKLSLSFRKIRGDITDTLLVITATAVKTAYKRPDEVIDALKFSTRHLANTYLSHIDVEAVSYLGYLPQEMIGRSIFEFYHPDDMPLLKEIYKSLLRIQGPTNWCKPYRFRTQNGGFVTLETEWSSFINPWSNKLEFITGQHRLLKGPSNPDVFAPQMEQQEIPEKILKESQLIQEEIKQILKEPILRRSELVKKEVSKRCKDFTALMESVMNNITKSEHKNSEDLSVKKESFSVKNSVMLGDISPHHQYCDSKSSSETPPSYKQLNFNENLQRFFDSKPRTLTSFSEKSDLKVCSFLKEGKKKFWKRNATKNEYPVNGNDNCSGSDSGLSNASNCLAGINDMGTGVCKNKKILEPVTVLTEAVLRRHNKDMEKVLMKRHRDLRVKSDKTDEIHSKSTIEKLKEYGHEVKRNGSTADKNNSVFKHKYAKFNLTNNYKSNVNAINNIIREETFPKSGISNFRKSQTHQQKFISANVWPSLSALSINQMIPPQATDTMRNTKMSIAGMMPMCFTTAGGNRALNAMQNMKINKMASMEHPFAANHLLMSGNAMKHQKDLVQFMNAFSVHPIMGCDTPSLLYSPILMAPQASPMPQMQPQVQRIVSKSESIKGPTKCQRPASQATSVKVETGSAVGSTGHFKDWKGNDLMIGSTDSDKSINYLSNEKKTEKIFELTRDSSIETGDESSYSCSSLLKTDDSIDSSEEMKPGFFQEKEKWDEIKRDIEEARPIQKEPFWLEKIDLTSELLYEYQLSNKEMTKVLSSDLEILKMSNQPKLVDEQLEQLYRDLETRGLSTKLKIEEDFAASDYSSSDGEEQPKPFVPKKVQQKKKHRDIFEHDMLSDENMPLPSPIPDIVVMNSLRVQRPAPECPSVQI